MRARPSTTAALVAFLRALANEGQTHVASFSDPWARLVLPRAWQILLDVTTPQLRRMPAQGRDAILSRLDAIALRTRAIDLELERAIAAGASQVVVLGAGLDTRAYRMQALASTHVFEVDHPATQEFKRTKARKLYPLCRALSHVPVDFERDSLQSCLTGAGFSRELVTAWVWEGVVMYLSDAALHDGLRAIAELSAPSSELILHYHELDRRARTLSLNQLMTRVWGEPQIGLRSRQQLQEEVERVGFRVVRDSGTHDWADQLGTSVVADYEVTRVARLLVGQKP